MWELWYQLDFQLKANQPWLPRPTNRRFLKCFLSVWYVKRVVGLLPLALSQAGVLMRVTQGRDHSRFSSDHDWLLTLCMCVCVCRNTVSICKFHSVSKMSCLTVFKSVWNNELSTNCIELQLWLIVYFCCWVWYATVAFRRDASLHALSGKGRKPPKEEVSLRDIDPIQFQAEAFLSSENQIELI